MRLHDFCVSALDHESVFIFHYRCSFLRGDFVPHSILEAIRQGIWTYEPEAARAERFSATDALPGSTEKLDVLAQRVQAGLPLWHPADRISYERSDRMRD